MQESITTLLNRKEAAESLRLSVRTLDKLIKREEIGHVRVGGGKKRATGRILFRPCDLESIAARHARPASVHAVLSAI